MQNEREILYPPLEYADYDISGNVFRAYYDADNKLVFVLDFTESQVKPNVLLVINPVGDRKWDDILMNDYGIDLETVRPKKDNKYQKLDIEYSGLAEYDDLIQAKIADEDLTVPLQNLEKFHDVAAQRAAYERLGAAELQAERARDTIEKTNATILDLNARLKGLRTKLAEQRREIGREPTKQSAAKILRTETQIDAANAKLSRAKKRLQKAKHRLESAEDDIDVANNILTVLEDKKATDVEFVATEKKEDYSQPKAREMAEEVKPLFDTDPKILDDEIAFKPVEFGAPVVAEPDLPAVVDDEPLPMPMPEVVTEPVVFAPVVDVPDVVPEVDSLVEQKSEVAPVTFTPPVIAEEVNYEEEPLAQPVLNTIRSVSEPVPQIDSELMPGIEMPQVSEMQWDTQVEAPAPKPEPISSSAQQMISDVEPAPIDTGMRPVSPIAGHDSYVAPVAVGTERQKPSMLYYFLLIVLIALSIFTLWFYQKSANKAMPELGAETVQEVVATEEVAPTAVVETVQEIQPVVEPEPVVVDVQPEPVPVVEPEPVQIAAVVEPQPVPVSKVIDDAIAEPKVNTIHSMSPFLDVEEEAKPVVPSEEEVLARKPVYGVSQNEKMFVADEDYVTDTMDDEVDVYDEEMFVDEYEDASDAQIIRPEPQIVNDYLPKAEHQLATQEVFEETETVEGCADGNMPDMDGCCSGEELRDVAGEYMCCAIGTDDCFPPIM